VPETLELNVKAKRTIPTPQPTPQALTGKVVLEVGKKYVTKSGKETYKIIEHVSGVWSTTSQGAIHGTMFRAENCKSPYITYLFWQDGYYQSCESQPDFHRHLAHEFISDEHTAWMQGKAVQYRTAIGGWVDFPQRIILGHMDYIFNKYQEYFRLGSFENPVKEMRVKPV
jgi:hypothetical protein